MQLKAPFFSDNATDLPFWWEEACPSPVQTDNLPSSTEVAIIGAGFTGLNAALVLARAGKQVSVFEADEPGYGASSRNGGFLGPGWAFFDTGMQYGADTARQIVEESFHSLQHVKDVVAMEKIDCDLKEVGYFKGAMAPRVYDAIGRNMDRIRKIIPCSAYMVPRSEQHKEIGSDLYHGGVAMPGYCGIHPAKYVKGLAEAAKRLGVKIYSNARVSNLEGKNGGFSFKVGSRTIAARQILLAANGYSGSLLPHLKRRIIPVGSGLITTEQLPVEVMDRLMPKRQMLAGSQRVVTYYRPSPDGTRIVFGGRVLNMSGAHESAVANAKYIRSLLLAVFPELELAKITNYWHGQLGFTFDHLPHVQTIDGMYFAGGYNGTGVARASWLGSRVAYEMLGSDLGKTVYRNLPFDGRRFYNGKPYFLPLAVWYYGMLDKWDQR
ncbi:Glycine/D-amino acid oxidase [Agrobacterium fabrum]|uniref:NAD(P)/FAD-dependent oxidoreductase n=1 Tax=Agrobacterium fabrum TaxID=1176649 RepID=UPI0008915B16|nr:FAD-binding oxidoreductase [Agrobacterium fabrum]SDB74084.1 Glycine/D-amino acid oxidase [Agrobacterium fabrum]SES21156.1 Glycine/D-amino acid oxidase [Agrobacterium fabrum]